MTVSRLLSEVSGAELAEWMAYERIDGPLGPVRGDYHAAQISQITTAVNRRKGQRQMSLQDLLLQWGGRRPQSPEEMLRAVKSITRAAGGDDQTREGGDRGDAGRAGGGGRRRH